MEYKKSVEIHQSSEDVKRSMSSRSLPDDLGRKRGVPETSIHGVSADAVSTANTANSVHGGMGNTYNNYFYLLGRQEEVMTTMIRPWRIGTQIDNVHKPTQDIPMSERKSRVRLDSESEKQVMVEDHSPQHRQQCVTDVAKDAAAEDPTDATLIAVTETTTGDASDATAEVPTGDASESGNDGEPPNNIKPSWVSALYRSMGILLRGGNTSQFKECLPGLEIREPDIQLQSNGLSLGNDETEHENTEDCIEADWVMVSEEDAVCSTHIVHEAIPRATSDTGDTIHHKVKVSQSTATHQGQSIHIDNMDHADMPFDTGGRDGNDGNGGSTSACGIQGDNQEIRLGNQVKECTTPHQNRHLENGGYSNMTRDVVNGVYTPSRQGTEIVEMQHKHLLEQWKKMAQRDQAIVKELLNNVIFHARNQPEGLRTLLPMLRMMSRDIEPGVPVHHNEIDDSYVRLLIFELTDIGCDLSRKTATNVVCYILTIGRNNPKLLLEIMEKMDHLDNISNHRIPDR